MKLEQIRQAIEVYNTGSINRAAQSLYIAQSSLSSSIKALERELGQSIFVRSQSGISLTSFGVEFVTHGREILKHMGAIEQYVSQSREQVLSFNVAVHFLFFASRLFTELCNRYRDEHITLNYVEETHSAIIQGVAEGKYEIGLLTMCSIKKPQWLGMMRELDLEYVHLTSAPPYVLLGPRCDLHQRTQSEVELAQVRGRPVISYPEEHPLLASIDEEVAHRICPGNFITVSDRGTTNNLLAQTSAIFLGVYHPRASLDSDFFTGIRRLLLRDANFMYELSYIKKRGHTLSFLAQEYLQSIKALLLD